MSTKGISNSGLAMGILAIVAGILVLFWFEAARWVLGIFLIVWGIMSIMNKR